ncbi:ROK family transcriptional regulator [Arthrobacter russicus]|uniref:NBD/HSP70 family sugar kinase n=1 Tax=Arthrobacter russicus TaxID=172040 RepID=A0ABU1JCI9_9MICC|nr:ROK family transcriptional regulator [Arthrobacter russicus]MDR6270146.1 putative NBD/HSP70 family sugar kinase [Arthrobacter russicus]
MGYRPSYAKHIRKTGPKDLALTEFSSAMLSLIANRAATSRADLARQLNLAPSTITLRVNELIDAGLITESGAGGHTGGRRPTLLRLVADAGCILAADLGAAHAWVGRLNMSGTLLDSSLITIDISQGPEEVLPAVAAAMRSLLEPAGPPVRGVGVALPGPVDLNRGVVDSPSRMRGWHDFPVRDWLYREFGTVASVDNDANMMALGEYTLRQQQNPDTKNRMDTLFLKAGAAIGCGLILQGQLYRGATGAAGDIAHVQVTAAGELPCACGNRGCLETVTSGNAIVAELAAAGLAVRDLNDVVRHSHSGDIRTTTRLRSAGKLLGQTLSTVVNFINPSLVVLGGGLSQAEPYIAAIKSQLYAGCHPLATKDLRIEESLAGSQAGLLGAGQQCLRSVLAGV